MPAPPAWSPDLLTDPHHVADKRRRVRTMFAAISGSYDLNNRLHSFGRDQAWRRAAVRMADVRPNERIIDVACGTGDLTILFAQDLFAARDESDMYSPPTRGQVLGVDFTYGMLPIAVRKAAVAPVVDEWADVPSPMEEVVAFINGDAQQLPLPDACCDVVSIAFGIRNVQDVAAALREFHRVLRPGGRVIVLEFSEPTNPILRTLNRFYCNTVMPRTATLISRDTSGAYAYLPKSVATFLTRQQMAEHLQAAGFTNIMQKPMTFGVVVAYCGEKSPASSPV